jgi:hypothetical protein
MSATEHRAIGFGAMADDTAVTVGARRREFLNRAFETIKGEALTVHADLERFVVFVPARYTFMHDLPFQRRSPGVYRASTLVYAFRMNGP